MGYARPERRFRREMLRQMDRVAVAGDFGEADHVGRIDGLLECLRHADREVLKIKHLQWQHFMALRVIRPAAGPGRRPVILAPCTSPRSMAFWAYYNHSSDACHAAHSVCHQYLRSHVARPRRVAEHRPGRTGDQPCPSGNAHPSVDGLRQSHQSVPINATLISASRVSTPIVALTP